MPRSQSLPWTTQGDFLYYAGGRGERLAAATNGQFLKTGGNGAGAVPSWVAVPAFSCQFASGGASGLNPADATTYYFGCLYAFAAGTSDDYPGFYVPVDCTLRAVYGRVTILGTLGTNENVTLSVRKNGTTDILTVSSTLQFTTAAVEFSITGQNVAVTTGDRLYMKFVCPTWVTNPTIVVIHCNLYFDVP